MTLRNRGEPSGFKKIAAPVMAPAMRRAMTKDLERLGGILTAHASPTATSRAADHRPGDRDISG
jgi:hypothetical protein